MVLEQVIQTVVIPGQLVGHEDEQAEGEVHAELHRYDLCRQQRGIPLGVAKGSALHGCPGFPNLRLKSKVFPNFSWP